MDDLTASIRKMIADDLSLASDRVAAERDEAPESPSVRSVDKRLPALEARLAFMAENVREKPEDEPAEEAEEAAPAISAPASDVAAAGSARTRAASVTPLPRRYGTPAGSAPRGALAEDRAARLALVRRGTGEADRATAAAPEPAPKADADEGLTSERTRQSVGRSFEALSRTVVPAQARTFEDVVGDLLRPMLREWLDANLGRIVEDEVRREIERTARRSR